MIIYTLNKLNKHVHLQKHPKYTAVNPWLNPNPKTSFDMKG